MTTYGFSDILKPCFLSLSPLFFHFTDQINCTLLLHLNLSHLLFYYFPPHLKDAFYPFFPDEKAFALPFPSLLLTKSPSMEMVLTYPPAFCSYFRMCTNI